MPSTITRLRLERIRRRLTQADLAALLNCRQTLVSAYERGVRVPTDEQLQRLGEIFLHANPAVFLQPVTSGPLLIELADPSDDAEVPSDAADR